MRERERKRERERERVRERRMKKFKVILLGDGGVGKSAIRKKFGEEATGEKTSGKVRLFSTTFVLHDLSPSLLCTHSHDLSPSLLCTHSHASHTQILTQSSFKAVKKGVSRKVVKVEDGKTVMLEVHDTGGMERYATIPRNYYTGVHGAIVLYDMTEPETLENAPWWHREGTRNGTESAVYMLMGNKVDAVKADTLEEETKRGKEKATGFGALYTQVSAKTGQNIEDAFRRLAQAMADSAEDDDTGRESKDSLKIRRKEQRSGRFCVLL